MASLPQCQMSVEGGFWREESSVWILEWWAILLEVVRLVSLKCYLLLLMQTGDSRKPKALSFVSKDANQGVWACSDTASPQHSWTCLKNAFYLPSVRIKNQTKAYVHLTFRICSYWRVKASMWNSIHYHLKLLGGQKEHGEWGHLRKEESRSRCRE